MKRNIGSRMMIITAIMMLMAFCLSPAVAYESSKTMAMAETGHTPNLQVLATKYEPYPVEPGEYFDVWLKIGNEGNSDIDDFTFELTHEYPFSLDAGETAKRHFGKIPSHSIMLVHYKVRVSEDAVEGANALNYRYRYVQSDLKWIEAQESIKVQTREAVLNIISVESEPDTIPPGKEANVTITLKNHAGSVIRDVLFKLDLSMSTVAQNPSSLTPTSAVIDYYYNAIPLVPVDSSTEKRIGHIKGGEEKKVTYHLKAFPDAESRVYKVPIRATYQDEVGRNYTKDDVVGITIGDVPELDIKVDDNNIYRAGMTGDATIRVVNRGVTDVKFFNIKLKESDSYDIISSDSVYVGDVDSDDYETVDFRLYVKGLEDDILKLPLEVQYRDSNNKPYSRELTLEMKAYSQNKREAGNGSSLSIVVLVLVLLGGAWLAYRRWEKKKRKKSQK